MAEVIDCRGLVCPQPVIITKKAMENYEELTVRVDNIAAVENVKRLAKSKGYQVSVKDGQDKTWSLHLIRESGAGGERVNLTPPEVVCGVQEKVAEKGSISGPTIVMITSDCMGQGNEELGRLLMRGFFHTLTQLDKLPDSIIFYNTGVKLTVKDSDVIEDLAQLAQAGVEILVCGTCTNYFNLTGQIGVGVISNMYDIASALAAAGRLIRP